MEKKFPGKITNFIKEWLYYRDTDFIVSNTENINKTVYKGLPQGAVLSPLLLFYYKLQLHSQEVDLVYK